jgi:hypothetical protein
VLPAREGGQTRAMKEEERSFLHLRTVTKAEKAAWNEAKDRCGQDLETWARETLNDGARRAGVEVIDRENKKED